MGTVRSVVGSGWGGGLDKYGGADEGGVRRREGSQDRQRQAGRETETPRDRDRDRDKAIKRDRERHRQRETERDRDMDGQVLGRQRQIYRQIETRAGAYMEKKDRQSQGGTGIGRDRDKHI